MNQDEFNKIKNHLNKHKAWIHLQYLLQVIKNGSNIETAKIAGLDFFSINNHKLKPEDDWEEERYWWRFSIDKQEFTLDDCYDSWGEDDLSSMIYNLERQNVKS